MDLEASPAGGVAFTALMGALRARRAGETSTKTDAVYARALTMAAVSSSFDPQEVRERLAPDDSSKALDILRQNCAVVVRGDRRMWLLDTEPRVSHLRTLADDGSLGRSIDECRIGIDDGLARTLRAYAEGHGKPIETQTLEELAWTGRVVTWLAGLVERLPDPDEVASAAAYQELLRPLCQLAGPGSHFSGRKEELSKLKAFLDVPDAARQPIWWKRGIEAFRTPRSAGAFAITGVGGAGKSALISKLILDFQDVDAHHRPPFAYLDFDRASLSPDDPAGLVLEMLRQISCQGPGRKRELDGIIGTLAEGYVASRADTAEETTGFASADPSLAVSCADPRLPPLVRALSAALGSPLSPFLLVLDTFEEAEHRSCLRLGRVREMLEVLREVLPALRVIISGRSSPGLIDFADGVDLNELEPFSAVAYLRVRGLAPQLAVAVTRQVGGLPLALRLAVKVIEEDGHDVSGVRDLAETGWFWKKIDHELVLGQLYDRVLGHIHDAGVRAIAHPGLVVRRITPDVIRHVIAPSCGMEVDDREAAGLYDGLASEGTLVVDEGDHLRHRKDVRAQTLSLMYKDRGKAIDDIHRRAATYWRDRPGAGAVERAEEIYHRLCLAEPFEVIERLWIAEAAPSLRPAVAELPDRAADMLRVLLGDVPLLLDEGATSAERRAAARAKAAEHLRRDEPDAALAVLVDVPVAERDDVAAVFLEAEALRQLFRWAEAVEALARVPRHQPTSYLVACHARCEMLFGLGRLDDASAIARAGVEVAAGLGMALESFELTLMSLACARHRRDEPAVGGLVRDASVSFASLSDADVRANPQVLRRYASLAGDSDERAVAAFFSHVELFALSAAEKSALAQALADWDRRTSGRIGDTGSTLARRAGVSITGTDELDLAWARFVEGASPEDLAQLLPRLLAGAELEGEDAHAFAGLIRFRCPEWRREASRALREAFPVLSELVDLATRALSASVAELPVHDRAEEPTSALVRWADTEGLLPLLLREAYAARPIASLELVSTALDNWVLASDRGEPLDGSAPARSDPPRRTAAPGVDLFELVKRFYEAPFVMRVRIAEELGLIERDERQMEAGPLSRLILQRAKEKGLLAAVAERLAA